MKRFNIDYKYLKISIYAIFIIFCAIFFEKTLSNIGLILENVSDFSKDARSVLAPFIYGMFVAYILNSAMNFIEYKVLLKISVFRNRPKLRRMLSLAVTYIALVGLLVWCVSFLIPEIYRNIRTLIINVQRVDFNSGIYVDNVITQFIVGINDTFGTNFNFRDIIDAIIEPVARSLTNIPSVINMLWTGTASMASGIIKFAIGLVISFYMLSDKESIGNTFKKFIMTFFRNKDTQKVIDVFSAGHVVFQNFIIGKAIDSIIVGIIFFITCLFLKPPYAILLSVIIGITNMIPYFGPVIGAVPVVFIVLIYNPMLAFWMAIDILIIQQFDGYILGPKILGDSIGLKPLGVIFAITIGGAMFGVVGMFVGVPLYAIIKKMCAALLDKLYEKKQGKTSAE